MIYPRTVRAKLTMIVALVTGGLLSGLCVVVDTVSRQSVLGGIDAELKMRGQQTQQGHDDAISRFQSGERMPIPLRIPVRDPFRTLGIRFFRINTSIKMPATDQPPYVLEAIADARLGKPRFDIVYSEGQPIRVYTQPLYEGKKVAAAVQIPYVLTDVYRALDDLRRVLLLLIPIGVAVGGLASLFVMNRLLAPLRHIVQRTEAINGSNLDERLQVVGGDEFAGLTSTLNRMLDRLQSAFRQEQETSRKLEASLVQQRRFTADASHELKTPLAVIKANTDLIRIDPVTAEQSEGLRAIVEASDRMNRLVQALLVLARSEGGARLPNREPCILAEVVRRGVGDLPSRAAIRIQIEDPGACLEGTFEDLSRVVRNLVENAVQHAEAAEISVTVRAHEIEVRDTGRGIAPEHLPHLFDRFYRVDASRTATTGGTGLGLAIVKSIVEAHGGTVAVKSQVGYGTTFLVRFASALSLDVKATAEASATT